MTDYVEITNAQIDPESPVTSELMTALRDNPIAITEGSSGAPPIQLAALGTIAAGTDVKISSDSEKSVESTSAIVIFGLTVVNTGVVRLTFRQKGGSFSTSCIVDVKLNGSLVTSFSTASSTYVSRSIDITVSSPTRLSVDLRGSSAQTVFVDQVRLSTDGETLWPLSGFGIESFVE